MTRSLRLRRETLTPLAADELSAVAGARQAVPTWDRCPLSGPYPSLPVRDCVVVQTTA